MIKSILHISVAVFIVGFFAACSPGNGQEQYKKLVKSELSTGKRHDSIFFGIRLGMPAKEFFTLCWELNKKGMFTDGHSNTAVQYRLTENELKHPASMHFYPEMIDNKISKMLASFQYDAWAPWNKNMFSDTLILDVLTLYKTWYKEGNEFIKITDPKQSPLYVKVDGNRRIVIRKKDDMIVEAEYTDLLKIKPAKTLESK